MTSTPSKATAGHTPGPWMAASRPSSVVGLPVVSQTGRSIASVTYFNLGEHFDKHDQESRANARLIAAAPETARQRDQLLEALKQIRLWLAEESCDEPLEIADDALRAVGITDVACPSCHGAGEWDEGPLPARSSAQIDPEYRQVKCPECTGTGRAAISRATGEA